MKRKKRPVGGRSRRPLRDAGQSDDGRPDINTPRDSKQQGSSLAVLFAHSQQFECVSNTDTAVVHRRCVQLDTRASLAEAKPRVVRFGGGVSITDTNPMFCRHKKARLGRALRWRMRRTVSAAHPCTDHLLVAGFESLEPRSTTRF